MIKALRRRFVITTMGVLVMLYSLMFVFLNVTFTQTEIQRSYSLMQRAALQDAPPRERPDSGHFVYRPSPDGSFSVSFSQLYTIKLDSSGNIIKATSASGEDLSEDTELKKLVSSALAQGGRQGKTGSYRYLIEPRPYGSVLVIADTHLEDSASGRLVRSTLIIGSAGLVLLFLASIYLSRFVTRPAEQAFDRQRRFISDASHELKTPLSVITVNADLLSSEIGHNKWLGYIKSEAGRMDRLIRQLLDLARLDDASRPRKTSVFSLSDALYEAVLPFESTAYERGIAFEIEIAEGCHINGESDGIKQLAAILLDNAFKHTPSSGTVSVKLKPRDSRIIFEVFNTGDGISPEDLPHVFERFYMGDKSRTGGGGYGLGLSIAQSIVSAHGGSIKAESESGKWARFTVTLPYDTGRINFVTAL